MKNEYTYKDGKIIVLDDKLGQIEYEYHDEIDEELTILNIIEEIQRSLQSSKYALGCQEIIKESNYNSKKRCLRYILNFLIPTIITGTLFMFLTAQLSLSIIASVFGMIIGTVSNISDKEKFNKVQNRINALLVRIDELNNRLVIENKRLNQLRSNKKVSSEQQIDDKKFKRINEDNLQGLSSLETLWYQAGYNIIDYYNYEKKGNLRKMLQDEYTHNGELDEVERITKKYGPVLTKKITPSKNIENK